MDDIVARIKGYVMVIDSGMTDNSYLDFIIEEVVDRALVYTNRQQLVAGYERFLLGVPNYYKGDYTRDITGTDQPILPIPTEVERPLARIVVGSHKTVEENVDSDATSVASIKDNGQEVVYRDTMVSYLSSKDDSEIFSSITKLLNKFRIPTIVANT